MEHVLVLGVGAMGSAACWHLAKRGARVTAFEQFGLGHTRGSSGGDTRLIRKAYFEGEAYVPLLIRAYELWDELAARARRTLFHRTGLCYWARPGKGVFAAVLRSAKAYGIPVEEPDAAECRRRWPCYTVPEGYAAVHEPDAGYLDVEACVMVHALEARRLGAEIREDEPVLSWAATRSGVEVTTAKGKVKGDRLVIAGGPWNAALLSELGLPLSAHRVTLHWYPGSAAHAAPDVPCFLIELDDGVFYGFVRDKDRLVKVAEHLPGPRVPDPSRVERAISRGDHSRIDGFLARCLPQVDPRPARSSVCMYTMTPDEHFLIDHHPEHPAVSFAAGFSGHGFKFASVVGEMLAELALDGRTRLDIGFLGSRRGFP